MLTHGNFGISVALRKPLLNAYQGRLWSRTGTWGRSESERVGEEKCIVVSLLPQASKFEAECKMCEDTE